MATLYEAACGTDVSVLAGLIGDVRIANEDGWLPLHFAAAFSPSVEVVQFLIDAYPDALKARDMFGNCPIHEAAGRNPSVDVFQTLLALYPEGMQPSPVTGRRPLHETSVRRNVPLLRAVYQADITALDEEDDEGHAPYELVSWLPTGTAAAAVREEESHRFFDSLFARRRWGLLKASTKLLALHKRGVIRANHPEAKFLRGEFDE